MSLQSSVLTEGWQTSTAAKGFPEGHQYAMARLYDHGSVDDVSATRLYRGHNDEYKSFLYHLNNRPGDEPVVKQ